MSNTTIQLPIPTGPPSEDTPDRPYAVFKDVLIPLRDGARLSANIYLPVSVTKQSSPAPAIASLGPYGKDIHIDEFGLPATDMYKKMCQDVTPRGPDYCFEVVDPLVWTKEFEYAVVRVDSRGIGKSEGRLDPFGYERTLEIEDDAEGQDLYDVIEWIGTQPWCSGKVATAGISYYGMIGYWTAIQQPPHLAAIICFEAAADVYQASRRGGIIGLNFQRMWFESLVLPRQRGYGILSAEQLAEERADFVAKISEFEFSTGKLWRILNEKRDFEKIQVPMLSAGNWTDAELHGPGNILAYNSVSSKHKWLQMHTGNHIKTFYEPEIVRRQKQFLDYFLKDDHGNGLLKVHSMRFWIRSTDPSKDHFRTEESFPPPDVTNMDLMLGKDGVLSVTDGADSQDASPLKYAGLTGRLVFNMSEPFDKPVEIFGSPYLNISVSTDAQDMDLFIYLRALSSENQLAHLRGNHDEMQSSFVRGHWRLSHREENILSGGIPVVKRTARSDVEKGRVYDVVVPLLPTSFRFVAGERLQLEIGATNEEDTIGPLRHDGPERSQERFGGTNVVFSGGRLVLPAVNRNS